MTELRDFIDSELAAALVSAEVLSNTAAARALQASKRAGTTLERTILELGLASEDSLFVALSGWLELPLVTKDQIDLGLLKSLQLDRAFLERVEAIPVTETKAGELIIATSNPRGRDALEGIGFHVGMKVTPALTTRSVIKTCLAAAFEGASKQDTQHGTEGDIQRLEALANEGPVIGQVNDLISEAVSVRASDIHIEAMQASARIRFRVDGALRQHRSMSLADCATFTSRLKIMGRMNISEKRRPQDGRAQVSVQGRNVDLRLSTLPTQHGESVVIRVLDQSRMELTWGALGYESDHVAEIEKIIHQPNGIFLVAGPTGSGKTTTLYTALAQINSEDRKIITVEDPIEYAMDGVAQVQVQPEIDMTFARALRAILRQDPDVVLIGEIRDQETAEIAVRAALVGRLVLSTVHTNDALSAVDRLLDLGVPAYLMAATLRGVLSQRLVRTVCVNCSGWGCDICEDTGQRGRRVVSELMPVTETARRELAGLSGGAELDEAAEIRRFRTLAEEGRRLVSERIVTEMEMARALGVWDIV